MTVGRNDIFVSVFLAQFFYAVSYNMHVYIHISCTSKCTLSPISFSMKHPQNQHKLEHLPPQDFVLHLTRIWLLDV